MMNFLVSLAGVTPTRRPQVPRLAFPDEGAEDQGVLVFHMFDDEENTFKTEISVYEPFQKDAEFEWRDHEDDRRRAYNLKPYFDLTNDMQLYAYPLEVPGYQGTELVTLLPKPTQHYLTTPVDFAGSFKDVPQHEHRLFSNGRMTNGRTFVSLPEGMHHFNEFSGTEELTSDHVKDFACEQGTFWIFLWNGATKDKFTMRLKPVQDTEDDDRGGRPCATGMVYTDPNVDGLIVEHLDLDHLDLPTHNVDGTQFETPIISNHMTPDSWQV